MTFLLDANVLIAMMDQDHIHHERAHSWFAEMGHASWATCPITENAVLRIMGHRTYPAQHSGPWTVAALLAQLCQLPGHLFWADSLSLVECEQVDTSRLTDSDQITDTYLLVLALHHGGQLATFDRRVITSAVRDGQKHLHVIRA